MPLWTKNSLEQLVSTDFCGRKLIVVSNREPYTHARTAHGVECTQPAGGLTAALDPIMRASHGTWVAHGSGSADHDVVDSRDRVRVPPADPAYTLRRVWLTAELEREYYHGFANQGLWPLCHMAFHRPQFSRQCWSSYREANQIFADAILEEADGDPAVVFVQDYHFALLPKLLKAANPRLTVAQFWHIPWPNPEIFRAFPWKEELLLGLLGNDLLGFHLPDDCSNFLDTVEVNTCSMVDFGHGSVHVDGGSTSVRPFPIGIDVEQHTKTAASPEIEACIAGWWKEIGHKPEILGIGIDRIDYTKGIPERLAALDLLLEEHPEYVGRLVFVQVGVPSRTAIPEYAALNEELLCKVDEINGRWGRGAWKPVVFVHRNVEQKHLIGLHLAADFCVVSSLHDGMNLVAKEFVASRIDQDGVLLLSAFTGAARELPDALPVNPFALDDLAAAMHQAIVMPPQERQHRMARMRQVVAANNVFRWAGKLLSAVAAIEGESWQPLPYRKARVA